MLPKTSAEKRGGSTAGEQRIFKRGEKKKTKGTPVYPFLYRCWGSDIGELGVIGREKRKKREELARGGVGRLKVEVNARVGGRCGSQSGGRALGGLLALPERESR